MCLRACDCCIALLISLWVTGKTNILLSLCPVLTQAAQCAAPVMHLNSTNTMFEAERKEPAFWLMSPWQLHNSWIVLAIHLSFANHNSGCVFGELQPAITLSVVSCTHTLKNKSYWKCWCILVLIWKAEALWKLPVLYEGPFSFMMNSQVCSFGKLHANSPPFIRLSVCLLAKAWPVLHWHVWCNSERRILIKALVQIICHKIIDWIYTETLKSNRIFNHMWARWWSFSPFIPLYTDQIQRLQGGLSLDPCIYFNSYINPTLSYVSNLTADNLTFFLVLKK